VSFSRRRGHRIQGRCRSGHGAADRTVEAYLQRRAADCLSLAWNLRRRGHADRLDAEYRWYIDPLDGTTNFAHGFPHFCVSMGLEHRAQGLAAEHDGPIVAGVIYDPMRDELVCGRARQGRVSERQADPCVAVPELGESLVATGFPSRKRHENPNIHFYQEFTLRSHGVRRAGSAALDLAYVACGRMDAYWEFNLNPWDTAAGFLLVEEAGGMVTGFDGSYRRWTAARFWPRTSTFIMRCWAFSRICLRGAI
jgi:myo-inositol-1(or 4)-monophosphatase